MNMRIGFVVLAAAVGLASWQASAQETRAPVMVVRFNQQYVPFKRPLYELAQQAVQVKPGVVFDVVGTPGNDAPMMAVVRALQEMGVPNRQISPYTSDTPGRSADEVYVYVR